MMISGSGHVPFQPIWADDVADCVISALPGGRLAEEANGARYGGAWYKRSVAVSPTARPAGL